MPTCSSRSPFTPPATAISRAALAERRRVPRERVRGEHEPRHIARRVADDTDDARRARVPRRPATRPHRHARAPTRCARKGRRSAPPGSGRPPTRTRPPLPPSTNARATAPRRRGRPTPAASARAAEGGHRVPRTARSIASRPGCIPAPLFVRTTAPVRSARSTRTAARNPGIEPVWPTKTRSPRRNSSRPRPEPAVQRSSSTIACTCAISSSTARASTPSAPVQRKSAQRARSALVDQSQPAAPVELGHVGIRLDADTIGIRLDEVRSRGGGAGRKRVRPRASGSSTRSSRTRSYERPLRAITSPSSAKARFE